MLTSEAVAEFESQGEIQPGTEGWWKVWGAGVIDIRHGDLIATLVDDELKYYYVEELFTAKAAPVRRGFVSDGERFTLGALTPVVVFRRETHNTLSEYCR